MLLRTPRRRMTAKSCSEPPRTPAEGGWRRPPEAIPAAFPPSDLLRGQPSVFYFMVLCFSTTSSLENIGGTIFIVIFRSRGSFGKKDRRKWSHEAKNGGSHVAQESGHVGLSILALRHPLLRLFLSYTFSLPKNDPRKFSCHLDVVWVPETQKYRK